MLNKSKTPTVPTVALLRSHLRRALVTRIPDTLVDPWATTAEIFFVLAVGRSGTRFLANLLNAVPGVRVEHEPLLSDFEAYRNTLQSPDSAWHYILNFRRKDIYIRALTANTYGEVNSVLRRHIHALIAAFPRGRFLHLVRDGRHAVRSMMARHTMTASDPNTRLIHPDSSDPFSSEWHSLDRFERICWYWTTENRYLRTAIGTTVRLEDLTTDKELFDEHVSSPFRIHVPSTSWEQARRRPLNVTDHHHHLLPEPEEWDDTLTEKFKRICGEEMRHYGYPI